MRLFGSVLLLLTFYCLVRFCLFNSFFLFLYVCVGVVLVRLFCLFLVFGFARASHCFFAMSVVRAHLCFLFVRVVVYVPVCLCIVSCLFVRLRVIVLC